jgi:hypothetical protein
MTQTMERFTVGSPLTYAIQGIEELSSRQRRKHKTLAEPIAERYGTNLSTETARTLDRLSNAVDPVPLIHAVRHAGLHKVEDWESKMPAETLSDLNTDEPDLSDAMSLLDQKLTEALCPREKDASKATSRTNRESVYIPELVGEGTVYMAKTLSSTGKVRMAWDLDDNNQVVVVDDYEVWEALLGWEKLKQFPHGKNKIQEEYSDKLSDDVLDSLVGGQGGDTETKTDDDSGSRGRRTRTKPSEEVLNLGLSRKHKKRTKLRAEKIAETFEDDGSISIGYGDSTDMLVLFPTTSDKLLSEHWWVAGRKPFGSGGVALANCNKGTFEYLNQYEQVWHIEDYLDQAGDYEFSTSAAPVTMNTAGSSNLVIHILTNETQEAFMRPKVFEHMTEALHTYCEDEVYNPPPLPHEDDMVYAPITRTDAFWLRPVLRQHFSPEDGDALVVTGSTSARDIPSKKSLSSDYKLYARARLNEWDFDAEELSTLDDCTGIYLSLDDGGLEVVETLGKLHDAGQDPFSETPQARWSA